MKREDLTRVVYGMLRVLWETTQDVKIMEWDELEDKSKEKWKTWINYIAQNGDNPMDDWPKYANPITYDDVSDFLIAILSTAIKNLCEDE